MKDINKRRFKASAITLFEEVDKGAQTIWLNTGGRIARSIAFSYWRNRADELSPIIKDCPNCTTDTVLTGYYWNDSFDKQGVNHKYCSEHSAEAETLIRGYNRNHKR